MNEMIKKVECTKVVPYKENGHLYLDWYGEATCDFGSNIMIHIPKMDANIDTVEITTNPEFDYHNCHSVTYRKQCFVEKTACDDIFFEVYDPDGDDTSDDYSDHIELSSDSEEWIKHEVRYHELRGYKVTSKSYLNNILYYDLDKE